MRRLGLWVARLLGRRGSSRRDIGRVDPGLHFLGQRLAGRCGDRIVEEHHDFVAAGGLPWTRQFRAGRGRVACRRGGGIRRLALGMDRRADAAGGGSFGWLGRQLRLWMRFLRRLLFLRVVDLVNDPDHEERQANENADDLVQAGGEAG